MKLLCWWGNYPLYRLLAYKWYVQDIQTQTSIDHGGKPSRNHLTVTYHHKPFLIKFLLSSGSSLCVASSLWCPYSISCVRSQCMWPCCLCPAPPTFAARKPKTLQLWWSPKGRSSWCPASGCPSTENTHIAVIRSTVDTRWCWCLPIWW